MPNFNYGKPLASPAALSFLIGEVSKLSCLPALSNTWGFLGRCADRCLGAYPSRVLLLKYSMSFPTITTKGHVFICPNTGWKGWRGTARIVTLEKKYESWTEASSEMLSTEKHFMIVKQRQWMQHYLRSVEYNEWLIQWRRWDPMGEGREGPGDEKTGK